MDQFTNNFAMKKQTDRELLQEYMKLKEGLELPVKIKLYLSIFENAIDQNKAPRTIESKKGFSKALLNAFSNLSLHEKGIYLLDSIKFLRQESEKAESQKTKCDSKLDLDDIRNIQTSCEMNFLMMKISYWSTVSFKLDKDKKQIQIINKKKNFLIDLRLYYVRKSKKYRASLVLETISQDINNQAKKYIFSFQSSIVNRIYEQILKCVMNCKNQKIFKLLHEEEQEDKDSKISQSSEKALVFLSSKNVNDYISYKQNVFKKLLSNKFEFRNIFSKQQLQIEQSYKVEKLFKMENVIMMPGKQLKEQFLTSLYKKNKYLCHSQVLQDFSKKYFAVYEKYLINGRVNELISIKEQNIGEQEELLFMKSLENIMNKNYLEFLLVKVRAINAFKSKLIIYCSVNLSPLITHQMVAAYLLELNNMIFREYKQQKQDQSGMENEIGQENDADEFFTVRGSQEMMEFVQDDSEEEEEKLEIKESLHNIEEDKNPKDQKYLTKNQVLYPLKPNYAQKQLLKEHFLFKQWVRLKNGGIISTNQAIINEQKRLFKHLLTKMGSNLLKGGNIFKISLPVHIFKKQSHLESIGRDFSYAPIFFQKPSLVKNCLEKLKYATLLCVSVGTLGISLDKPFNPILGQTLQLWIDGCPMYLQQISHHPPIGAYFFQGRGYKIHGMIEPKINLGMNNVKGFSERPNFIQFEDGTKIQMTYGKMIIKGMLFGEREFNFQEKIYAYDQTNHFFSEINYGPRKKRILHKNEQPLDYFHGKIYRLKPEFLPRFLHSFPRIYPTKEFIIEQVSQFEGIWNDSVKFDGKEYINFRTQLPCKLEHEEAPLPSNSTHRMDLVRLQQNKVDEAQEEKQRLEEIQRRDRNLREKNRKKY